MIDWMVNSVKCVSDLLSFTPKRPHMHLSLKVPNIKLNFEVSVKFDFENLMVQFDVKVF